MSGTFSVNAFEADLREILAAQVEPRWPLIRLPGAITVVALMCRTSDPADRFVVRLSWQQYPDDPPSLKFLDPGTGRDDVPTAWPSGGPFRPQSLDTCANYCTEGFGLHPEWRLDAVVRWSTDGNVLLKVLHSIQDDLDNMSLGRFRQ